MEPIRILAFAGSTRRGSLNKKLLAAALPGAQTAGAEVTHVDLADFPMPLYDGDLEATEGMPEPARRFKALLESHHGLLIAAPEYNGSLSAVLKNAIDWASRTESEGEPALRAFRGKVAALMAASPGGLGGIRVLAHLRQILGGLGVHVLPDQLTVPRAGQAFGEGDDPADEALAKRARSLAADLVALTGKLRD